MQVNRKNHSDKKGRIRNTPNDILLLALYCPAVPDFKREWDKGMDDLSYLTPYNCLFPKRVEIEQEEFIAILEFVFVKCHGCTSYNLSKKKKRKKKKKEDPSNYQHRKGPKIQQFIQLSSRTNGLLWMYLYLDHHSLIHGVSRAMHRGKQEWLFSYFQWWWKLTKLVQSHMKTPDRIGRQGIGLEWKYNQATNQQELTICSGIQLLKRKFL